jgi:hypothetical protein
MTSQNSELIIIQAVMPAPGTPNPYPHIMGHLPFLLILLEG